MERLGAKLTTELLDNQTSVVRYTKDSQSITIALDKRLQEYNYHIVLARAIANIVYGIDFSKD